MQPNEAVWKEAEASAKCSRYSVNPLQLQLSLISAISATPVVACIASCLEYLRCEEDRAAMLAASLIGFKGRLCQSRVAAYDLLQSLCLRPRTTLRHRFENHLQQLLSHSYLLR